jgi:hypothetical protein
MTEFQELSHKNQARILAKEAAGDLAHVNKIKGHLVVIMTEKARKMYSVNAWRNQVGGAIRRAIPGWEIIKQVNGLIILEVRYGGGR